MTTLNLTIASDADDGIDDQSTWDDRDNTYSIAEFFQVKKTSGGTDNRGGVRFTSIAMAQGVTISSAILTLHKVSGGLDSLTVYGDDVDNAPAWSNSSRPHSGFTATTASGSVSTFPANDTDFTIDIKTVIQELVDRAGWVSGNAMRFALVGAATYAGLNITDYDLSPTDTTADAARLDITYSSAEITASPATMVDGTTGYTLTTTGFGSEVSSVKLVSKQDATRFFTLAFSGSSGNYTIDSPNVKAFTSNTVGCPFADADSYDTHELQVSDGTDTATADTVFSPATGWDTVKTGTNPIIAEGSIYENFTGLFQAITAVSIANPTTLTMTAHGFTDGQDLTITELVTSADATGENVFTLTNANSGTIPVNVATVTTGVGKALSGVANEHGQVLFPTDNGNSVSADGTQYVGMTSNFYEQYYDYVDATWKPVLVTVTAGGTGPVNQPIINFPWLWD